MEIDQNEISKFILGGLINNPTPLNMNLGLFSDTIDAGAIQSGGLPIPSPEVEIWLVHGTDGLWGGINSSHEDHWPIEFIEHLMEEFNIPRDNIHTPNWDGALNGNVRALQGEVFGSVLNHHIKENPVNRRIIVGYSHGGNVAIQGLNRLSNNYGVDLGNITLVTVGTPARPDYRIGKNTNLNAHINVYNERDFIQRLGGSILGFGGRRAESAINITVDRYVPRGWDNILGRPAHSSMHNNLDIWRHYILPNLWRALECSE